MLRSLYSGISGMRAFQTKLDVIGNNISNVNTVGFKAGRVMFKDILSQTIAGVTAPNNGNGGVNPQQIGLGVSVGAIDTLQTQGAAQTTNVVTDMRIDGDGFFVVNATPDQTTPYLTRAGNFTLDSERKLVTSSGGLVLDSTGSPITIPDGVTSFSIGQDGSIIGINSDGTSTDTGIKIGVAVVANPGGLEKIGNNLYQVTPNATSDGTVTVGQADDPTAGSGAIISGQLEMSNVDLTSEFTEMIVAERGFQANSRIITTSDNVLQEIVNLVH